MPPTSLATSPVRRRRVVIVSAAVSMSLALLGDQMLYTVLPSHYTAAGIGVASLGIMLSVHRFIRLVANPVGGALYDRFGRRRLYLLGMAFAVVATFGYFLSHGFWSLLVARLVWGLAYALLLVGSLSIILDVTDVSDRGKTLGLYQVLNGTGTLIGLIMSGVLTDLVGYRATLAIYTPLTALGWLIAFAGVRETSSRRSRALAPDPPPQERGPSSFVSLLREGRLATLAIASFVNSFTNHGVLGATVGIYLAEAQTTQGPVGLLVIPVASLTGALLASRRLSSMLAAPVAGHVSDLIGDRRIVACAGTVASLGGFAVFLAGPGAWTIPIGVVLAALGEGTLGTSLSAWMGDAAPEEMRGILMGGYATVNDLGAALGPLVGYALGAALGFRSAYGLSAVLLAAALGVLVSAPGTSARASP